MRNKLLLSFLFVLILTGIYVPVSYSQSPTYNCTLSNDAYTSDNVYEFDIYLLRTGTSAFELGGFQMGLTYDTLASNGGTVTATWVPLTTDTSALLHTPAPYKAGFIKVASFHPRGSGKGKIVSNTAPGFRVGRLRLTNSIPFTSRPLSVNWTFATYPSKISAYVSTVNNDITNQISFLNTLANTGNTKRVLTLTTFIEGYTNSGGTAMSLAPAAVTVELHSATSPYTLVESQTAPLSTIGVGTFNFSTAVNGTNYYIVIKSWNSVETWSGTPQSFTIDALSYNFTSAGTQAYGSNMVQKGSAWCIFSGDLDQGGYVGVADLSLVANDNASFVSGSTATDINGDGYVGVADLSIVANNNALFVAKVVPAGAPSILRVKKPAITNVQQQK